MRINPQGNYEYCRWAKRPDEYHENIKNINPVTYFQEHMSDLRTQLLNGEFPTGCQECQEQEKHMKVSGRQRQLLKIGVLSDHFEKSLLSSPWIDEFVYSMNHNGHTNLKPIDWQVDLGNYCNSACLFCHPVFSSRLALEWKKVGLLSEVPESSWVDDPETIKDLISELILTPNLKYLHFIGGETLITPSFKLFLSELVQAGTAKSITIGFTTNLTVWRDDVVELLKQFSGLNLGVSIESLHPVNDYARWPSQLDIVKENLDRWVSLGKEHDWLIQLRITPTLLTIGTLDTIYEYAYQNEISVESCNFLTRPEFLRASVLPTQNRLDAANKLQNWINNWPVLENNKITNTRNPTVARSQVLQDAQSYVDYLRNAVDESYLLPDLVRYLKTMESLHQNSILDYLPEYEEFLRAAGY